ncbi:hypothetical protein [Burkholderia lata]|uniref:Filamentous hemagglutinin outer membrane protein n=1 Tax=Burkholderia lata (strain ATCC 17760 / DSM 23089 / LMG 22485 / NCIMB 9086 / R18194 / 383) TaxID=482957 RepID=A0A6P2U7W1_BURL3|nr:hypothetical protein [Burkholderia lata]VWC65406.1 hypothetical protein BLA18109_02093 [Burkholderia lata]
MPLSTGGLAGWNSGEISNVTAQNVNVAANGVAYIGSSISKSFSSGTISGGRDSNLGGLARVNLGRIQRSTTDSSIAFTSGHDQTYGALDRINYGTLNGNRASGNENGVALAGSNLGVLKDQAPR